MVPPSDKRPRRVARPQVFWIGDYWGSTESLVAANYNFTYAVRREVQRRRYSA